MNEHFTRPKRFGEVLDQTFRISKNNFSTFFMIMLILIGPVVLLEALILLLTGSSFLRDVGSGTSFFEQFTNTIYETAYEPTSIGEDLGNLLIGIATIVLYPVAQAAILFVLDAKRRQEEFTVGSVIKEAFSRFWPILGSTLLFGVIIFGMAFFPMFLMIIGIVLNPLVGVGIAIFLGLAILCAIAFFGTRWGLYLPAVTFESCAPGLGRSWNLTRRNFWRTLGLLVVLGLIIAVISSVFEMIFMAFLGTSVLYTILLNLVTMLTTMLFAVGYGLIYFDLKLRNDGDDLKDMMESYDNPKE